MVVYCIRWCLSRRRACGPTGLCLVDRLPAGVLLVLAGDVPGHHGGPAAERHLGGGVHEVAALAVAGEAARCDPIHVRDFGVQEVEHLHPHHVAFLYHSDACTGGPDNERQLQPFLLPSRPSRSPTTGGLTEWFWELIDFEFSFQF